MRKRNQVAVLALMALLCLFTCCQPVDTVRLMSYNIRNGRGMDGHRDLLRVAKVIRGYAPDVVAVQEVDSMTARSGSHDVLRELAMLTGMTPCYAPAIDFDGGKYGIGMLFKGEPRSVFRIPLPGREERRMLLAMEFDDYVFACTHLSLTEKDRLLSLPLLEEAAIRIPDKPFFLAGDFNAEPADSFLQALTDRFTILTDTTVRTYPADVPDRTIDYIVTAASQRGGVKETSLVVLTTGDDEIVTEGQQLEAVASDHRPICIDVRMKKIK